ncbi:MAG: hypothetical protein FH762_19690 [Firmicutes bacterium]|nr:hypothetical protein [Bacillota bacterium]
MKFERLIKKYSRTYTVKHKTEGHWDGPNWIEGSEVNYQIDAAIFPISAEQVQRYEGLGYTTQDIKVFITVPIEALNLETEEIEVIELKKDDEISYLDNKYVFDTVNDRTTHADFVKWIAVRKQDDSS